MSEPTRKRDLWTVVLFSLLLLGGIGLTALGVYLAATGAGYVVLGLGVLAIVVVAAAAAVVQKMDGGDATEQTELLRSIEQRVNMSELARRMADRERDREALRQAILTDIQERDFEAAMALVDEMAEQFGYREEAERYRQQIIDARENERARQIREAVDRVETVIEKHDWQAANREVARLRRLYPESTEIQALPERIEQARDQHKRELEREFLRAAKVDDTEKAMQLLKELDRYLTPDEAEAYHETARGVIGQARENIAVRFRIAISDRDWVEAANVGEQIIREFPNTKMADEVRDMMDLLRERAAGQRAAGSRV